MIKCLFVGGPCHGETQELTKHNDGNPASVVKVFNHSSGHGVSVREHTYNRVPWFHNHKHCWIFVHSNIPLSAKDILEYCPNIHIYFEED